MNMEQKPLPIGVRLVAKGLITEDQVKIALLEQRRCGEPLARLLVKMGFITEATARDALSESFGQNSISLSGLVVDAEALALIPRDLARRHRLLPVSFDKETRILQVAMADTYNVIALDQIQAVIGPDITIEPMLAGEAELEQSVDQFYSFELSIDGILEEIETGTVDYRSLASAGLEEYRQPVVRLVDAILADAVKMRASDIHFEPEAEFSRIRYRIDGVLRQIRSLHRNYWPAIVVRLKIIAGMNIAENRAPQDGRTTLRVGGREVDFRVSAQPTLHGENLVLRVLDRNQSIVPLDKLGLTESNLNKVRLLLSRPEGIILVTGPTGSGKTTTLYSILSHINSGSINIMTLEDPVEYPMNLIRQTSVNEIAKIDFATGIRSMMRQDPDVILVGEIRDKDTAEMALRAAMTGHQVYSTLHTNSALGVVPRLLDIGILPDILAGNIIGVIAQRLVRRLCPKCKQQYQPDKLESQLLGLEPGGEAPTIYQAVGCEFCDQQGYRGRIALMEILRMDQDLDELIIQRATPKELKSMALQKGFQPLASEAIRYVLNGTTSLPEVSRVIDLTDQIAVQNLA